MGILQIFFLFKRAKPFTLGRVFELLFGSILNCTAIVIGGSVGLIFSKKLSKDDLTKVENWIGYSLFVLGLHMAIKMQNPALCIGFFLLGAFVGDKIQLEERMERALNSILSKSTVIFNRSLLEASVIFCAGSMAILGSFESALEGKHDILLSKAVLDGLICVTFCALYGWGPLFAFIPVLIYQSTFTLLAAELEFLKSEASLANLNGVGGFLVFLIGLKLTKLQNVKLLNFLPAIFLIILYYFVREVI